MSKIALLTIASIFGGISACSNQDNKVTNVDIFDSLSTNVPNPNLNTPLNGNIISNKKVNTPLSCGKEVKDEAISRQADTGGHCKSKDGKTLYIVKCDFSNNFLHCSIR